jgi:enoyl-CoA hydratase
MTAPLHNTGAGAGTGLSVRRDGDTLHLQLHRPDKGNALSTALVNALTTELQQALQDPELRLLVLSGEGRHFCTGFDLSDLDSETDDSLLARFARVELLLQTVYRAPFTTLALAHGRTMGAGADLFAACSERWVVGDALFAFPGVNFGLVLGTSRLSDLVGATRAAQWLQASDSVSRDEALTAQLATRHVAIDAQDEALHQLQQRLRRLDRGTQHAIHAALGTARRPRGDAGDAQDLERLVQSAARPGLRDRIATYRAAQRKN